MRSTVIGPAKARTNPASSNNCPLPISAVLQRKSRFEQEAARGRVQHQRSSLNNRIIQRAVGVPGPVDPIEQAKQAAAHLGGAYSGDDPDTDFGNWYQQGGYWNSLPAHAYSAVEDEFRFPIKIRSLDLELVQLSQTLQGIQAKKLPGLDRATKEKLLKLIDNYNIKLPPEVGDIMPQHGIRPNQRKHYLKIKTALVAMGRFVAGLHTDQNETRKHEAMLLKHVGFVDKLLQAFSGQLCHNDYSKGLYATLEPIPIMLGH